MPGANPGLRLGINTDLFYWSIHSSDLLMTQMIWTECLSPPNSYVEILTSNVLIIGGGAFGMQLGHEGEILKNGINVPIIRDM